MYIFIFFLSSTPTFSPRSAELRLFFYITRSSLLSLMQSKSWTWNHVIALPVNHQVPSHSSRWWRRLTPIDLRNGRSEREREIEREEKIENEQSETTIERRVPKTGKERTRETAGNWGRSVIRIRNGGGSSARHTWHTTPRTTASEINVPEKAYCQATGCKSNCSGSLLPKIESSANTYCVCTVQHYGTTITITYAVVYSLYRCTVCISPRLHIALTFSSHSIASLFLFRTTLLLNHHSYTTTPNRQYIYIYI